MDQTLAGIALILSCVLIFIGAFRSFSKGNINTAIFLLFFGGLLLRIFTSADFYLHDWDERFHALVAKNLIKHPLKPTLYDQAILDFDYRIWSGNHIWVHKQPLPLWTIAGSLALFGFNELALRLPSILFGSICIVLIFHVAKHFFNSKTGFFAAFLMAINGLVIEIGAGRVATDHVDLFFLFFILLAVFFSVKHIHSGKRYYAFLIGLSMACAILSKWLPALIILPFWFLMLYDSGKFSLKEMAKCLFIGSFIAFLIAAPWQWYIYEYFPLEAQWEAEFNWKHFTTVLDGREGSAFYFLDQIRINYGELIYLPLLWFLIKSIRNFTEKKYLILLIWALIPLVVFSLAKTKMQGYILCTAPAYFIMTAAFFHYLVKECKGAEKKWFRLGVMVIFLALPIRYAFERIKPLDSKERKPQWVLDLKNLKNDSDSKTILFNYPRPIEAMFYTDLTAYQKLVDLSKLEELIQDGYTIWIYNSPQLQPELKHLPNIKIIELPGRIPL